MNGGLRVLVVDDHPVVRRGVRAMLAGEPWVAEVFEADTVAGAVREAVIRAVHLVAMDVMLPDGDGIDAARRILHARPETRVLILTMADDEDIAARALRAGAHGYVLKLTEPETVVGALRAVAAGSIVLGPAIGPTMLTAARRETAVLPPPFDQLTPRERQIVTLLAKGESNARIARRLGVSEKTIRNQLTPLFTKLGVTDRVQAALKARDAGFGDRPPMPA